MTNNHKIQCAAFFVGLLSITEASAASQLCGSREAVVRVIQTNHSNLEPTDAIYLQGLVYVPGDPPIGFVQQYRGEDGTALVVVGQRMEDGTWRACFAPPIREDQ